MQLNNFVTRCVSVAALFLTVTSSSNAGEVTLQTLDQSLTLTGDLISFDGATYHLNGVMGEVDVDAAMVTCIAGDCPVFLDETAFTITVSNFVDMHLLPSFIEYFALSKDMSYFTELNAASGSTIYSLENNVGDDVVDISVLAGSGGSTMEALMNGSSAIGIVSSVPAFYGSSEAPAFDGPLQPSSENAIAIDGIAFVVSPENPVDTLSSAEISGIFSGQISNWSDVGGADRPIAVYGLDDSTSYAQFFNDSILAPEGVTLAAGAQLFANSQDLAAAVASDPNAVGFSSYVFSENAKVLSVQDTCGIRMSPSQFSLKSEDYQMTNILHLVHAGGQQTAMTVDFLNFVESNDAHMALQYNGYVNTEIVEQDFTEQGERLISLILGGKDINSSAKIIEITTDFRYARRLSTTFRFDFSAVNIDADNQYKLMELVEYINANYLPNTEIVVAGFTDTGLSSRLNSLLSEQAAETIGDLLAENLGNNDFNVVTKGYGDLLPIACDSTATGKSINQRVEIWVRSL